jgi:two-component system sensor histidine kinase DesK
MRTNSNAVWRRVRDALTSPNVLFSLIWQVFLIYPVLAVVYSGAPTATTVLGLASIAVFSGVYLAGFASPAVTRDYPLHLRRAARPTRDPSPLAARGESPLASRGEAPLAADENWLDHPAGTPAPLGLGYLAGLVVCAFGTLPAAGINGPTNFLPFIACFTAAAWPLRRSVPAAVALIVLGCGAALLESNVAMLIPCFLVIPVVLSMIGTRISVGISDREGHYRRALGVVEERERMARDLHDVLGHTLTALTIRAQLARARLDSDPDITRAELENIETLTRTALAEMRQTVSGMRVADPARELADLTGSLRAAGMDVRVDGTPDLVPAQYAVLVAWTLREAGTNIARHSEARRVTVEFTAGGVRVTDDGRGIHARREAGSGTGEGPGTAGTGTAGRGLEGLAARAADAGARFEVRDRSAAAAGVGAAGPGKGWPGAETHETGTVVAVGWAR